MWLFCINIDNIGGNYNVHQKKLGQAGNIFAYFVVDCEDSSEDEATSSSNIISKSQKSASQSSKPTNQNQQAPPQTTTNSTQEATQQGTTFQPRAVNQTWGRGKASCSPSVEVIFFHAFY